MTRIYNRDTVKLPLLIITLTPAQVPPDVLHLHYDLSSGAAAAAVQRARKLAMPICESSDNFSRSQSVAHHPRLCIVTVGHAYPHTFTFIRAVKLDTSRRGRNFSRSRGMHLISVWRRKHG